MAKVGGLALLLLFGAGCIGAQGYGVPAQAGLELAVATAHEQDPGLVLYHVHAGTLDRATMLEAPLTGNHERWSYLFGRLPEATCDWSCDIELALVVEVENGTEVRFAGEPRSYAFAGASDPPLSSLEWDIDSDEAMLIFLEANATARAAAAMPRTFLQMDLGYDADVDRAFWYITVWGGDEQGIPLGAGMPWIDARTGEAYDYQDYFDLKDEWKEGFSQGGQVVLDSPNDRFAFRIDHRFHAGLHLVLNTTDPAFTGASHAVVYLPQGGTVEVASTSLPNGPGPSATIEDPVVGEYRVEVFLEAGVAATYRFSACTTGAYGYDRELGSNAACRMD